MLQIRACINKCLKDKGEKTEGREKPKPQGKGPTTHLLHKFMKSYEGNPRLIQL